MAELLRLNSLTRELHAPPPIAELREKVRRRTFLVRERTKLKVKIKGVLAYEGVRPPKEHGLYTWKDKEWLDSSYSPHL